MPTTCVYHLLGADGGLLYIGCSSDMFLRLMGHRNTKEWWPDVASIQLAHYATRDEALVAERQAIESENPRYNLRHNDIFGPPAPRPEVVPPVSDGTNFELTTAAAAELLGVHYSSVTKWAVEDKLPHWRTPGGHRRFRRSDVEAFIAADGLAS